jgi:hypothetical protein
MSAVKKTKDVTIQKAVFCTCWDGDISLAFNNSTMPTVETTLAKCLDAAG